MSRSGGGRKGGIWVAGGRRQGNEGEAWAGRSVGGEVGVREGGRNIDRPRGWGGEQMRVGRAVREGWLGRAWVWGGEGWVGGGR